MQLSLVPATEADVHTLALIAAEACKDDRNTRVKSLGKDDYLENMMDGAILSWMRGDRCKVIKAIDPSSEAILGWVCWATRLRSNAPQQPKEPPSDEEANAAPAAEPEDPAEALDKLSHDDLVRWMDIFMPDADTECMYVVTIAIDPKYQSQGIGTALLRWGTERADAQGLFCWVHSSEAGRNAFPKAGFEEVGHLTVDLDKYAKRPREDGDGDPSWGPYTFRYFKRPAKAVDRV